MLLSELHGYHKYEDMTGRELAVYLQSHNIKVKHGAFGIVLIPSDKNYVYRFWTKDSGYEEFLEYIKDHKSDHFPKILSKVKEIPIVFKRSSDTQDKKFKMIKTEKLDPFKGTEAMHVNKITNALSQPGKKINSIDALRAWCSTTRMVEDQDKREMLKLIDGNADFWKTVIELKRYFDTNPLSEFDIHSENMMVRSNGEWVITDPAYPIARHFSKSAVDIVFDNARGDTVTGRK